MPMKRCDNGHYFDPQKHSSCPYCGVNLDIERTRRIQKEQTKQTPVVGTEKHSSESTDVGATIRKPFGVRDFDPVVGWLVCIVGKDKGLDYRIHSDRNFIGRSPEMDISIQGDDGISRERHAVITFNPRNKNFTIVPGDGRSLVFLNGKEINSPESLRPYDRIEISSSTFVFVPFCGDQFQWKED